MSYSIKSFSDKVAQLIQVMTEGHFPWLLEAAVGMERVLVRRMHHDAESQVLEQWVCLRFFGDYGLQAPHPYFAEHICIWRGKILLMIDNGDKRCTTSFIWGLISAEPAVITNFLSRLTQHFCQRKPGHAVCSQADLLFSADLSSCFRLKVMAFRAELFQTLNWNIIAEC